MRRYNETSHHWFAGTPRLIIEEPTLPGGLFTFCILSVTPPRVYETARVFASAAGPLVGGFWV